MAMDAFYRPAAIFDRQAFRGQSFLLTGGAHGIGRATVLHLAALGGHVVAVDISERFIERFEERIPERLRERIVLMRGDVNSSADMTAAITQCHERFGRIDGLINNAMSAEHGPIREQSAASMTRVWKTNVLAAWRNIKQTLPIMEAQGGGAVVNISSIMAERIAWDAAPYTSSKASLEGLTRALAVELAPSRVRVNAIAPGPISTRESRDRPNPGVPDEVWTEYREILEKFRTARQSMLHPWPDLGRPRDIAGAVSFLLSSAASFITGAVLRIDGGAMCYDNMFRHKEAQEIEPLHQRIEELRAAYPKLGKRRR